MTDPNYVVTYDVCGELSELSRVLDKKAAAIDDEKASALRTALREAIKAEGGVFCANSSYEVTSQLAVGDLFDRIISLAKKEANEAFNFDLFRLYAFTVVFDSEMPLFVSFDVTKGSAAEEKIHEQVRGGIHIADSTYVMPAGCPHVAADGATICNHRVCEPWKSHVGVASGCRVSRV